MFHLALVSLVLLLWRDIKRWQMLFCNSRGNHHISVLTSTHVLITFSYVCVETVYIPDLYISVYVDLFNVLLNLAWKYFIEYFCLCSSGKIVYSLLFCCTLIWFWCQGNTGLTDEFWSVSSVSLVWICLRSSGVSFSLKVKLGNESIQSWSGFCFCCCWKTLIIALISVFLINTCLCHVD